MPSPEARAAAQTVVLADADTSVATVMAKLPDPERLPPGTLVLVPGSSGERSLARSVLAVFGRAKSVPRAVRCTALVARGYRDVGAAEDLAWGFVGPIGG